MCGVAFSPDGGQLATAAGRSAFVWSPPGGTELGHVSHHVLLRGVAFSPNGDRIATAGEDNTARVWDLHP